MKVLICGTRGKFKDYKELVLGVLSGIGDAEIVEGCCKDSADEYAEIWAREHGVKIHHYPANEGTYIKRNVEMVDACDRVIAFWDGWSYGTSHTIAQAIMKRKSVMVIQLEKAPVNHGSLRGWVK